MCGLHALEVLVKYVSGRASAGISVLLVKASTLLAQRMLHYQVRSVLTPAFHLTVGTFSRVCLAAVDLNLHFTGIYFTYVSKITFSQISNNEKNVLLNFLLIFLSVSLFFSYSKLI